MRIPLHLRSSLLLALFASACELPPSSLSSDGEVPLPSRPPPGQCLTPEASCTSVDDTCCEGTFCEDGPYTPETGRCVAQRADGVPCGFSLQCESGVCNASGRCGAEVCAELGESCESAPCCANSFCERNVYLESFGRCVPRLEDGSFCEVDAQCVSDRCVESQCSGVVPVGSVDFSRIFQEVLVPNGCTGGYCHGGGAGGLTLSNEDAAYEALVNTSAVGPGCEGAPRVYPGLVEASLVWGKIAPGMPAPCGSKMPPAGGALLAGSLALMEAWIRAGAPR